MAAAALTACKASQPEPADADDTPVVVDDAPPSPEEPVAVDPPAVAEPPEQPAPVEPAPAESSVADNKPAPKPAPTAAQPVKPQKPWNDRPMVARYGVSPRLPPSPKKK